MAARQKREERYDRLPDIRLPEWLSRISGGEALLGFILIAIALYLPVIAVFIAGFIAYFAHRSGEIVQRNFALAAVALALIVLIVISFAEGGYELLPWVRQDPPFPD